MRPRITTTPKASCEYGSETYTILGHKEIFFYRRVEAVLKTKEYAIKKGAKIIMLLNGVLFCQFEKNGSYKYIYDSSKDQKSSPELKQLFIQKGIAVN